MNARSRRSCWPCGSRSRWPPSTWSRGAKEQILEVYLNHVYLGKGFYGVEAAAQGYFGKSSKDLSLAEAAILAGLPKAPALDSPDGHFDRAKDRQRYVLGRMLELGSITRAEHDAAVAEEIVNIRPSHQLNATAAPYACEEVRRYAEKTYGYDAVYKRRPADPLDLRPGPPGEGAGGRPLRPARSRAPPRLRRPGRARRRRRRPLRSSRRMGGRQRHRAQRTRHRARRESMTLCVRGSRFELEPDDVKRVGSWNGPSQDAPSSSATS